MKSEIKVPDGWKDMPLGEILNVGTGKKNVQDSIENGKYPFFTRSVETQRINSWSYDCEGLFIAGEGNFSVRYYKGKFELHQRCYLLSALNEKSISMKFLQNAIQIKINNLIRTAVKSTVISLRKPIIEKLKILLPPFEEQQKIADILSKVDEQIDSTERIIDKTEELKKGLMQKLLTKGIGHTKIKKTELGEMPEEWRIKKITDCCHVNKKSISSSTNENYEISYIDIASIEYPGQNPYRKQVLLKNAPSRARRRVFDNNILVSTVRPYLRSFTFIENAEENLICSTGFGVLEAKGENHPQFIYQCILSDMFLSQVAKRLVGSNYPAINNDDLKNIKIPLPSNFNEQKQIASILSKVDEQITDNKKELNHLKELKKGLMQDLLTGKVRVTT